MKRHILFIICLLASSWYVHAEPVDVDAARQKAAEFLKGEKAKGTRRRAPAARQLTMAAAGPEGSYYIFNAKDGQGYVVVSGDDATADILGYSNTGTIDTTFMPCGMRMLLDSYADQISFLRKNGITRKQNSRSKADEAPVASYTIDEGRRCKFDQIPPYNKSCHEIGGEPAYTGCVATAMAGLMYAHKWPKQTIREIPGYSYWTSPFNRESVEGAPAHTAIDWDNIVPQYTTYYYDENNDMKPRLLDDIKPEQCTAVATLMELAGISVKMEYEEDESGAQIYDVPKALKEYFGYEETIIYAQKKKKDRVTWLSGLREEIMTNGPVLYGGRRTDEQGKTHGHAFLLEGFDGDYFTVNFGWSGIRDGNYRLDLIEGDDKLIRYPDDQCALFYVKPIPHVELEVTQLYISRGSVEDCTFTGTTLRGNISIHHKGNAGNVKVIFLKLTEVETGEWTPKVLITNLSPDDSDTFRFSFSGLNIGSHYVLSALDFFEDAFYRSPELLCAEDPAFAENDETPGNETLTRFEYWFDDNFAARKVKTLSSRKAVLTGNINTDHLPNGLHHLHFRVQRDDNKWSGISTSPFLKIDRSAEARLDYWLDDDYASRVSLPLGENEDEQLLTFDLSECSVGLHQLCYQVTLPGSLPSTVQRDAVMKMPMGVAPQMEYWFDDNVGEATTLTGRSVDALGGYVYINSIDMSNLSIGLHRVNFRATGTDGLKRSSVMSCSVFRPPLGATPQLEYWFDDDLAHSHTLNGKDASAGDGYIFTNKLNLKSLSVGPHRLNFRATGSDGVRRSAVMTSYVVKVPIGKGTELEYWYDDDEAHAIVLDGVSEDSCLVYDSQLNMSSLPIGLHRLNFRAVSNDGQLKSPVVTCYVMRSVIGSISRLEYWFDNDRDNVRTLSGHAAEAGEKGYIFVDELDISGLCPGYHRLHYRGVSSDGRLSTAIGEASVVMKLDVNGNATMAAYSISVDDGDPIVQGSLAAKAEVTFSYVLDAINLEKGTHMLHTTFWNNYGCSVSEATPFFVTTIDEDAVIAPQADDEVDGPIYNLSGIRVTGKAKGILIKNGKKYVVK